MTLASAVGNPLYADAATESCRRISYARICVELDAKKPLIKEFLADTYNSAEGAISSSTTIKVVYQWKPAHCSNCEVFGHSSDCCPSTDLAPSQAAKSTPSPAEQAKEVVCLSQLQPQSLNGNRNWPPLIHYE